MPAALLKMTPSARAQLRATGVRITPARAAVFKLLHESERALSHQEIESGLGRANPLDRVTVYRVLDWLVEQGLAHKVAGLDRVWRFSIITRTSRAAWRSTASTAR